MSSGISASSKRMKLKGATANGNEDAEEDRISALPDSLLIHILSLLGCKKEVVRTCLLSKRWEFIWTDLFSEVNLHESSYDIAKERVFVDWVGRMISMCKNLKRFEVCFHYDKCFASNVKHWVYFAIKNNVNDIALMFTNTRVQSMCALPQVLYSHSSLTKLSIRFCVMAPLGIIAWGSLEHLKIERVELLDSVMENILSNCPVLRCLKLYFCRGLNYLNIGSPCLKTLELCTSHENPNILDISAPYLLVLSISNYASGRQFKLTDVSSVVRATVYLYDSYIRGMRTENNVKQLLEGLQSVKSLELGHKCTQIVSVLESKSIELPLYSQLQCLTLRVWSHKMSIPGIIAILRSSPKLKSLHIIGYIPGLWKTDLDRYGIHLKDCNMDLVASHLKTVKFTDFTEQDLAAEHMLTLLQILLKSTKDLEKMVISVSDPSSGNSIDSMKLAKKMLTFPRASPVGVVVFC